MLITKVHSRYKTAPLAMCRWAVLLVPCLVSLVIPVQSFAQRRSHSTALAAHAITTEILIQILRAEDERRWDSQTAGLLANTSAEVRTRAALAAGRIGDPAAVSGLSELLKADKDNAVRAMAAFALGEIESADAIEVLVAELNNPDNPTSIRARSIEALGKIVAAIPKAEEARARSTGEIIQRSLSKEAGSSDTQLVLLGLTAALRARPEGAGKVIAQFLISSNARVRADAANALARLRAKEGNSQLLKALKDDADPIVRANAARVLGATEEKTAAAGLIDALGDNDRRVRVSAIRALATLKGDEARNALAAMNCERRDEPECPELITALGRIFEATKNIEVVQRLKTWRGDFASSLPELEIAIARISPGEYLKLVGKDALGTVWENPRLASHIAQGLGEIAALPETDQTRKEFAVQAEALIRAMLDYDNGGVKPKAGQHPEYAEPDLLRALAAFKPSDLAGVLRAHLNDSDAVVRSTAAELLGELPSDKTTSAALVAALPKALEDKQMNDAALSILDALGKQKNDAANLGIKSALTSEDHLVRKRAESLLKANGLDFTNNGTTVQTKNRTADYRRAISRIGKSVNAKVVTNRGTFQIQLLPEEAPLTVDNFVQLARRGYFNGISFHRVVPNFVIQGGDPRGDGNGGPGYSIRCEINEIPYERGAVGMALSGKDTGGSQWFVTHSPQPHLDGGYTVFGNVINGMDVVDKIVRGDLIHTITITEH
jgi:cyclophilin family peptidyl-prolyl cis-trans isomerase/HEAT repeat protein